MTKVANRQLDKNICHYSKRAQTCYLLCKRPGCYHIANKTHVRDRIFKLSPFHASVIISFPEFTEFRESSAPFRKNSIVWSFPKKLGFTLRMNSSITHSQYDFTRGFAFMIYLSSGFNCFTYVNSWWSLGGVEPSSNSSRQTQGNWLRVTSVKIHTSHGKVKDSVKTLIIPMKRKGKLTIRKDISSI